MGFPFRDIAECRLTNIYGKPNKNYSSGKHDGVDLVSDGDKTVLSISNGKVIRSGYSEAWGNYIVIEMQDGRAVVYAHLSSRKVIVGEYVTAGRPIGVMGNTGNSFGAHLHIEIQRQYYKAGRVDDICAFMGIKNITGKVELIKVEEDEEMVRYQKLEEVPSWARPTVEKLIAKKVIAGGSSGLDLSDDMLRVLVWNDRAGLYDK